MKTYRVFLSTIIVFSILFSGCKPESQEVFDKIELQTAIHGKTFFTHDATPAKLIGELSAYLDLSDGMTLVDGDMHKTFILSDLDATFEVPNVLFVKNAAEMADAHPTNDIHLFTPEFMYLEPKEVQNKRYKVHSKTGESHVQKVRCRIKQFDYDNYQIIYGQIRYLVHAPCDNHVRYGVTIKVEFSTRPKSNTVTYAVAFGHYDATDYKKEKMIPIVSSAKPTTIHLE